jgi:hypothetical protein
VSKRRRTYQHESSTDSVLDEAITTVVLGDSEACVTRRIWSDGTSAFLVSAGGPARSFPTEEEAREHLAARLAELRTDPDLPRSELYRLRCRLLSVRGQDLSHLDTPTSRLASAEIWDFSDMTDEELLQYASVTKTVREHISGGPLAMVAELAELGREMALRELLVQAGNDINIGPVSVQYPPENAEGPPYPPFVVECEACDFREEAGDEAGAFGVGQRHNEKHPGYVRDSSAHVGGVFDQFGNVEAAGEDPGQFPTDPEPLNPEPEVHTPEVPTPVPDDAPEEEKEARTVPIAEDKLVVRRRRNGKQGEPETVGSVPEVLNEQNKVAEKSVNPSVQPGITWTGTSSPSFTIGVPPGNYVSNGIISSTSGTLTLAPSQGTYQTAVNVVPPPSSSTLGCGHTATGLVARVGSKALCFQCGTRQEVIASVSFQPEGAAKTAGEDRTWSPGKPCPECGGPTLASTPGDENEEGDYCEACGFTFDDQGRRLSSETKKVKQAGITDYYDVVVHWRGDEVGVVEFESRDEATARAHLEEYQNRLDVFRAWLINRGTGQVAATEYPRISRKATYVPQGRTDESSYDYTDRPTDLASKFDKDQLQRALDEAEPGDKSVMLKFDYEEYVPIEAVREALALGGGYYGTRKIAVGVGDRVMVDYQDTDDEKQWRVRSFGVVTAVEGIGPLAIYVVKDDEDDSEHRCYDHEIREMHRGTKKATVFRFHGDRGTLRVTAEDESDAYDKEYDRGYAAGRSDGEEGDGAVDEDESRGYKEGYAAGYADGEADSFYASKTYGHRTASDVCHCGSPMRGSDHCPYCLCEQYESTCNEVYMAEHECEEQIPGRTCNGEECGICSEECTACFPPVLGSRIATSDQFLGDLGIETWEVRNRDSLDFYEVSKAAMRGVIEKIWIDAGHSDSVPAEVWEAARRELDWDSMELQGRDHLDFPDTSVWVVEAAIQAVQALAKTSSKTANDEDHKRGYKDGLSAAAEGLPNDPGDSDSADYQSGYSAGYVDGQVAVGDQDFEDDDWITSSSDYDQGAEDAFAGHPYDPPALEDLRLDVSEHDVGVPSVAHPQATEEVREYKDGYIDGALEQAEQPVDLGDLTASKSLAVVARHYNSPWFRSSVPILNPVNEQNIAAHVAAWHVKARTVEEHNRIHVSAGSGGVFMGHKHAEAPYGGEQQYVGRSEALTARKSQLLPGRGAKTASLDDCPTCGRRITDVDDNGLEANDGQRWCRDHAPAGWDQDSITASQYPEYVQVGDEADYDAWLQHLADETSGNQFGHDRKACSWCGGRQRPYYDEQGMMHFPGTKTASYPIQGGCGACGGHGEQGNGYECYICDGSGTREAEIEGRAFGVTNANPENGLLQGLDLTLGQKQVLASVYEVRNAKDWRGAWAPAGDTITEAEAVVRTKRDRSSPSNIVLLRNTENGAVNVYEVDALGYFGERGTYEQFYGAPFQSGKTAGWEEFTDRSQDGAGTDFWVHETEKFELIVQPAYDGDGWEYSVTVPGKETISGKVLADEGSVDVAMQTAEAVLRNEFGISSSRKQAELGGSSPGDTKDQRGWTWTQLRGPEQYQLWQTVQGQWTYVLDQTMFSRYNVQAIDKNDSRHTYKLGVDVSWTEGTGICKDHWENLPINESLAKKRHAERTNRPKALSAR